MAPHATMPSMSIPPTLPLSVQATTGSWQRLPPCLLHSISTLRMRPMPHLKSPSTCRVLPEFTMTPKWHVWSRWLRTTASVFLWSISPRRSSTQTTNWSIPSLSMRATVTCSLTRGSPMPSPHTCILCSMATARCTWSALPPSRSAPTM